MPRYDVRLDDLHAHLYRVTLTLERPAAAQRLSLPVWIPGSYLVREFARHLSGLEARQGSRKVPLQQLDKTTWLARCEGRGALTVSYRVYAFDTSVRSAWLDDRRGFFNGTSLFLRAEGREAEEHRLGLSGLPRGWQVATALRPVGKPGRAGGRAAAGYSAADYDELIDHPVELGRFWRGEFKAHGVPHELVVSGAGDDFDGERLLADTQRICETEIAFWHGPAAAAGSRTARTARGVRSAAASGASSTSGAPGRPPFDRYVFLLNTIDEGYGGLEHRASTALLASRRDLPRRGVAPAVTLAGEGYVTLLGLISHEYFHTWNVKRLLPAEFAPYDLTRENPTELLWFFEGFTSYYDDLLLRRAGLIDVPRYLKLLAKPLNQVLATPGRRVQSLAQASFDAWTKFYRPDENTANLTVNYYTKGSLVALALDLTLRRRGRTTLDEVMREVWQQAARRVEESQGAGAVESPGAGAGKGGPGHHGTLPVDEADLLAAVSRLGGRAVAETLRGWVHGTEDPPWRELLAEAGVAWRHDPPALGQRLGARLGEGLKVQAVMHGGAAHAGGLAVHDELIGVNDWRVRRPEDLAPLGVGEKPVRLLVARDGRLVELKLPAGRVDGAVALAPDAQAAAAALRRREAWLGT